MNPIRRLEGNVAQELKAASVISDTAIIVVELVSNALDAGATSIEIRLHGIAGLEKIEVNDNGSGIAPADRGMLCRLGFTSKNHAIVAGQAAEGGDNGAALKQTSDSYGFRGIALSSIAQICEKLEIATLCDGKDVAEKLVFQSLPASNRVGVIQTYPANEGGISFVSRARYSQMKQKGTTITVCRLYEHFPVRREHLTQGSSCKAEERKLLDSMMQRIRELCYIHRNVKITLKQDDKPSKLQIAARAASATPMQSFCSVMTTQSQLWHRIESQFTLDNNSHDIVSLALFVPKFGSRVPQKDRGTAGSMLFFNRFPVEVSSLKSIEKSIKSILAKVFPQEKDLFVLMDVRLPNDVFSLVDTRKRSPLIDKEIEQALIKHILDSIRGYYEEQEKQEKAKQPSSAAAASSSTSTAPFPEAGPSPARTLSVATVSHASVVQTWQQQPVVQPMRSPQQSTVAKILPQKRLAPVKQEEIEDQEVPSLSAASSASSASIGSGEMIRSEEPPAKRIKQEELATDLAEMQRYIETAETNRILSMPAAAPQPLIFHQQQQVRVKQEQQPVTQMRQVPVPSQPPLVSVPISTSKVMPQPAYHHFPIPSISSISTTAMPRVPAMPLARPPVVAAQQVEQPVQLRTSLDAVAKRFSEIKIRESMLKSVVDILLPSRADIQHGRVEPICLHPEDNGFALVLYRYINSAQLEEVQLILFDMMSLAREMMQETVVNSIAQQLETALRPMEAVQPIAELEYTEDVMAALSDSRIQGLLRKCGLGIEIQMGQLVLARSVRKQHGWFQTMDVLASFCLPTQDGQQAKVSWVKSLLDWGKSYRCEYLSPDDLDQKLTAFVQQALLACSPCLSRFVQQQIEQHHIPTFTLKDISEKLRKLSEFISIEDWSKIFASEGQLSPETLPMVRYFASEQDVFPKDGDTLDEGEDVMQQ